MKKFPITFLSTILFSLPVFAQEEVEVEETIEETAPVSTPEQDQMDPSTVEMAQPSSKISSAQTRKNKSISAGIRAGFMYTLVPGIGAEGFYHLGNDLQVGLYAATGKLDFKASADKDNDNNSDDDDKSELKKAKLNASSIGVAAKWFPLNSFYTTGGLSFRLVDTDIVVADKDNESNSLNVTTDSRSLCLDLGIGNQWSFDSGLTIGAEWFGVSAALTSDANADTKTSGSPDGDTVKSSDETKKFAEKLGKAMSFRIAMFTIGWAF